MNELEPEEARKNLTNDLSELDGVEVCECPEQTLVSMRDGNTVFIEYSGEGRNGEYAFQASTTYMNRDSAMRAIESLGSAAGEDYWIELVY